MQKTSRTLSVTATDNAENVVRLPRRAVFNRDEETSNPEEIVELSALMERVSIAARQVRYFELALKKFSFVELGVSAGRAGFVQTRANSQLKEATFAWAGGQRDLIFSVSYRDPDKISMVAESQADVFGLILTSYAHVVGVSVEINPTIDDKDLGHNASLFKDMLLTFAGFDNMPAWAKYPEGYIPETGGVVDMWRKGFSLTSAFDRTLNSVFPRVTTMLERLRERWYPSR